ncbi:MAG: HIT domain-containing protein [Candidatus Woesearchaeota archaeon]|nr:HIT domain-containing protein [Candidatus Woesearchaeota archaeon]
MQQLTEEQHAQLPPEQIAELQKQQCIFCHIIAGKVASKKVYEDEACMGILDINPANPGHVLLLPKEHYAVMPHMPDDVVKKISVAAKKISHAMLRAFKSEGTNIFLANGVAAGQKAQHCMVHIIPRREGDGVTAFYLPKKELDEKEAEGLKTVLKRSMAKMLGGDEEKEERNEEKGEEASNEKSLDSIAKLFA